MFRIQDVIKLLTRIFAKQNKRFPKGLEAVDIRIKAKEIHDVGKSQGYKGGISEDQLKQFLAFEKQAKPKEVIAKEAADVFDLTGKKIPSGSQIMGGKEVKGTHQEKIDWLVKNVSSKGEVGIPPKETLEQMLKDGREDLIDHFYELYTKELGKPKINIDTSGLKHPALVEKMMKDKKLKPTLAFEKPGGITELIEKGDITVGKAPKNAKIDFRRQKRRFRQTN